MLKRNFPDLAVAVISYDAILFISEHQLGLRAFEPICIQVDDRSEAGWEPPRLMVDRGVKG
jgi:hypothetical protein